MQNFIETNSLFKHSIDILPEICHRGSIHFTYSPLETYIITYGAKIVDHDIENSIIYDLIFREKSGMI